MSEPLRGPRPGHVLLYEELARLVADGTWPPDHQIPSERELCERYRMSRTTVRQALATAERRGLVVRVPGRGTFVARSHVQADLSIMIAFRDAMSQQGITPGIAVLGTGWTSPTPAVRDALRLAPGLPALAVRWTPLAHGQPVGVFDSCLVPTVAAAVEQGLAAGDGGAAPTYELAARGLGVDTLLVDQTFDADVADREAARDLGIEPGTGVFRVTSLFRTLAGMPVEHNTAIFAGARYTLHMVRQLRLGGPG